MSSSSSASSSPAAPPTAPVTAPQVSSALQAQLNVLREAYGAKLDGKIEQICAHWSEYLALADPLEKENALVVLHRTAHTLAGSGATFGFPEVSVAARQLERQLKELLSLGPAAVPSKKADIDLSLTGLQSAARQQDEGENFAGPVEGPPQRQNSRSIYLLCISGDGKISSVPAWASSLSPFGYKTRFFLDLDSLQRAWEQNLPDALILDCLDDPLRCQSNGVLLSKALTQMMAEVEKPVPLLWTCHNSHLRARLQAVRLDGAAFFSYPVDVDSLLAKLEDLTAHAAPEPFRVLIVDDEPSLGRLFSVVLRQAGMETLVISDPTQVMEPLVDFRPDLILMDVYMPGCSGIELAAVIRQQEAYIGIPIMFLSVETDVAKQLAAMRHGGDDFLIKPVQPRHLVSAITTRATRSRSLRGLMVRDSLTGLLNHTKTTEQLSIELDRARRLGNSVSLVIIDIDHFKAVNDEFGHATGDRVLRSLSRLLGQCLRQTDVVGRYGGEEFAVIMNGSSAEDAQRKIEEVRAVFEALPHFYDERQFFVTFSAGIASSPPFAEVGTLCEAANSALSQSKQSGRNKIVLAEGNALWTKRKPL